MTRSTAILAGAFMLTSLVLAVMAGHMNKGSIVDSTVVEEPVAAEKTAAPAEKPADTKKNAAPAAPAVPKPE
jgi:preprotein translocase subunit SecG